MPDEERVPEEGTIAARIRLSNLSEAPLEHVNHHYIHHTPDSFFVYLTQIVPPPVLLMTDEERSTLEYVDAKVVAKVQMTPSQFKAFVDSAVENYQNWEKANAQQRRRRTRK